MTPAIDALVLADKNYVYKNISNTENIKPIGRGINVTGTVDDHLYTDSSFKRSFVMLTKYQKSALIAAFIAKELKVNDKYAADLMLAYFVSKQQKIGELQPIVVFITGDDYSSMTMILLNKNNKPVGGINLSGGIDLGPTEIGDSLISFDKNSYSHISKNQITTYKISETDHKDSTKKGVIIDSNVFVSTIEKTGKIVTKQTVKARLQKAQ